MEGPQRCDEARDALAVRVIGSFMQTGPLLHQRDDGIEDNREDSAAETA